MSDSTPRREFVKRRPPATPGSIPDVLGIFTAELRFYREIAPEVGVRVPALYRAEDGPEGTLLAVEDLSDWAEGADAVTYATTLRTLHERWRGRAEARWEWVRRPGAGAAEVAALWAGVWPSLAAHPGLTPGVREAGERLLEYVEPSSPPGPLTLCHGDASARNARTGPDGEVALLDWEDVSLGTGTDDLVWMLVSSTDPERWDEAIAAYAPSRDLTPEWPDALQQGLFSLSDDPDGPEAEGWCTRLAEAHRRLTA